MVYKMNRKTEKNDWSLRSLSYENTINFINENNEKKWLILVEHIPWARHYSKCFHILTLNSYNNLMKYVLLLFLVYRRGN